MRTHPHLRRSRRPHGVGSFLLAGVLAGAAGCAASAGPAPTPTDWPDPPPPPSGAFDQATADAFDARLEVALALHPGVSAAVIRDDRLWAGVAGLADSDRPVEPPVAFPLAGLTRTVVAAQVLRLAADGLVDLDADVQRYLPDDVDLDTNAATVRDLLAMRSGIPGPDVPTARNPEQTWSALGVLGEVPPERLPRTELLDSDTNYILLGLVVEQVTGSPLAQVLREGVLAGDDLARVVVQPDERPEPPLAMPYYDGRFWVGFHNLGKGYLPSIGAVSAFSGAANLASDATSMAYWVSLLGDGHVVDAASWDLMTDTADDGYGLGLADLTDRAGLGTTALGHGSTLDGYSAYLLTVPDEGVVVVALANTEAQGNPALGPLASALAGIALEAGPPPGS